MGRARGSYQQANQKHLNSNASITSYHLPWEFTRKRRKKVSASKVIQSIIGMVFLPNPCNAFALFSFLHESVPATNTWSSFIFYTVYFKKKKKNMFFTLYTPPIKVLINPLGGPPTSYPATENHWTKKNEVTQEAKSYYFFQKLHKIPCDIQM